MENINRPLRYFLYARKSSEDDDRQILSIQSQIDEAKKRYPELLIVEVLSESASAHKPNNRPIFAKMMERIGNGEADGIIAWHPDRLSRNPIDGANIIYSLDNGILKDLKFTAFTFENSPEGKMMLNIMLGQSKYFSDKLSKDIRRGNVAKLKTGQFPGMAKQGYKNVHSEDGSKTIEIREPQFQLIRRAWDLLLTGVYTVPMILKKMNNEWGYRTPQGKPMNRSTLYSIFTNEFYAGWMVRKEGRFEGKYQTMITLQEFERAQFILGRPGKPRYSKNQLPFAGMITCGECGCCITGDVKLHCYCYECHKKFSLTHQRSTCPDCGKSAYADKMKLLPYTFLHCSHSKPQAKCQQKSIRAEKLDEQIADYLKTIYLPETFTTWIIRWLKQSNQQEIEQHNIQLESLQQAYKLNQQKLDRLVDMRLSDQITDEQYSERKLNLTREQNSLNEQLTGFQYRINRWMELTENSLNFATQAPERFNNGSIEDKRLILGTIGSNLILTDGKLRIEAQKPFELISHTINTFATKNLTIEPTENMDISSQNSAIQPVLQNLC